MLGSRLLARHNPPDRVADIVGDEKGALTVDRDPDRPPHRLAVGALEPGENIFHWPIGLTILKRDKYDFVATPGLAVPRAMLPNEGTAHVVRREEVRGIKD